MSDSTEPSDDTLPTNAPMTAEPAQADVVRDPHPRIRFGTIAWGLIVCAIAATTLAVIGDPERRDAFGSWLLQLDGRAAVNIAVLAFGALLLLLGLLAVIRRAQRAR
jgi:hypothetical protein